MKRTTIQFAPLLCAAALLAPSMTSGSREPAASALELTKPGEPTPARVSADRTGSLQTSDGLTLRLSTDLGSVKIVPLEGGSAPVVRYTVHIETDARAPLAQHLLDHYSLSAKSTPAGVEITGKLPPQSAHLSGAQIWVQFEIAVPRNYSVEVKTEAGDIETGDIGGIAMLTTQGGNIRAGRIGIGNMRNATAERVVARLETEGGHIQVPAGRKRAQVPGNVLHLDVAAFCLEPRNHAFRRRVPHIADANAAGADVAALRRQHRDTPDVPRLDVARFRLHLDAVITWHRYFELYPDLRTRQMRRLRWQVSGYFDSRESGLRA